MGEEVEKLVERLNKARDGLDGIVTHPRILSPEGDSPVSEAMWALRDALAALSAPVEERKGDMVSVGESAVQGTDSLGPREAELAGWALTFSELEDLHAAVAGIVTYNERWVPDVEARWERLNGWLTQLAIAANERFPANWKGLPEAALASSTPESSDQADLERYAALGRACESNGLGWYGEDGQMLFQPPADLIAEQAAEIATRELAAVRRELAEAYEKLAQRKANGWELQSSIYEGFSTEIWADGRPPGQRTVAIVRDYQDALTIMGALATPAEARSEQAEGERG